MTTPEEIAGTEKPAEGPAEGDLRKCPGCGVGQMFNKAWIASSRHASDCPWLRAWDEWPDMGLAVRSENADCHWKEFLPKPAVHLTPESVGKAYRTRAGWKVVLGWHQDGSALDYYARTLDGLSTYHAYFGDGKSCTSNKNFDLISEWDEKAEAGDCPPSNGQAASVAKKAELAQPSSPAQPAIPADAAGFYQWMWGYPQPFEVGKAEPKPVGSLCAACGGMKQVKGNPYKLAPIPLELLKMAHAAMQEITEHLPDDEKGEHFCDLEAFEQHFMRVTCPECQGSGEQAGR